ncbi:MAG: hypothetical protein WC606_05840 [Candidatus Absconditabacterales bacterium]
MKTKKSKALILGLVALGSVGTMALFGISTASNTNANDITTNVAIQSGDTLIETATELSATGTEVNDGQEINSNDEQDGETKDDKVTLPTNAINEAQASQTALQANPGTKVTGISTEDEDGMSQQG